MLVPEELPLARNKRGQEMNNESESNSPIILGYPAAEEAVLALSEGRSAERELCQEDNADTYWRLPMDEQNDIGYAINSPTISVAHLPYRPYRRDLKSAENEILGPKHSILTQSSIIAQGWKAIDLVQIMLQQISLYHLRSLVCLISN